MPHDRQDRTTFDDPAATTIFDGPGGTMKMRSVWRGRGLSDAIGAHRFGRLTLVLPVCMLRSTRRLRRLRRWIATRTPDFACHHVKALVRRHARAVLEQPG